jgi:ribosomal-protein-alanine N-acetyltransferase
MALEQLPGILMTERLVLRPLEPGDAGVMRQLWSERDERVPPHRRLDDEGRPTVEELAARLRAEAPDSGLLAVERKGVGDVIGYCGINALDDAPPDEPELAFELLRAVHNHGYATEAGGAVVAWAREAGYSRLRAGVWDWNVASRRVLQKLGFREVGNVGPRSPHGQSLMTIRDLGV